MEYPLISEYREAILSAEDNFNELASLRPVLDSHGDPVMSSGNFAVVFKMRDESDGKLYAVKCFIKDQEGRDESYRKIADELEVISSSYILPLRYLENELFVDSAQCDREEFPVVVMEWVDGETLDAYLNRNLNDKYELEMLSYRFNRMAAWLLAQLFAHGDIKPDNILVRKDGSLVLVDYDGMFVPSMKGEKAREIGSPDYRHPSRTDSDFNEHIDDFSIAVIALSLKAIALNPNLKSNSSDVLLLSEKDYRSPNESSILTAIQGLTSSPIISILLGIFYISLAKNSLDSISFRLYITDKPNHPIKVNVNSSFEIIDTSCTDKDIKEGVEDEYGVVYSHDSKRLLKCTRDLTEYSIQQDTQIICDNAFAMKRSLRSITIPNSVTTIGNYSFYECKSLQNATIPDSLTIIGEGAFAGCHYLMLRISENSQFKLINNLLIDKSKRLVSCLNHSRKITIPNSVTAIGSHAFLRCELLYSVSIPESVTHIGDNAFAWCKSLLNASITESVKFIGKRAFLGCTSLLSITIPKHITYIGDGAFSYCPYLKLNITTNSQFKLINGLLIDKSEKLISCLNYSQNVTIPEFVKVICDSAFSLCKSLRSISIPNSVTHIGDHAFSWCESLQNLTIPESVNTIGKGAFLGCESLHSITIPVSITSIGDRTFSLCESLQNVTIPESVNTIGKGAFLGCKSLHNITIPASVTSIRDKSFSGCDSLQSITIPKSVTHIGEDVFPSSCKVLRK